MSHIYNNSTDTKGSHPLGKNAHTKRLKIRILKNCNSPGSGKDPACRMMTLQKPGWQDL